MKLYFNALSLIVFLVFAYGPVVCFAAEDDKRIVQTLEDTSKGRNSTIIEEYSDIQVKSYQSGMRLGTQSYRKSYQDVSKGIYQAVYKIVKGKWLPGNPSADVWRQLKYRGDLVGVKLWGRQVIHDGKVLYELIMQRAVKGLHLEVLLRTRNFSAGKTAVNQALKLFLKNAEHNKLGTGLFKLRTASISSTAERVKEADNKTDRKNSKPVKIIERKRPRVINKPKPKKEAEVIKVVKEEAPKAVKKTIEAPSAEKPASTPKKIVAVKPKATGVKSVKKPDTPKIGVEGLWEGVVTSTRNGVSERFQVRINNVSETNFEGNWQGGINISNGRRRGNVYIWESFKLQDGCRDYKARLDIKPNMKSAMVIVLVKDRCQKPAQFSSSGILNRK